MAARLLAAAAVLAMLSGAVAKDTKPIDKVITMLEDLQTDVILEGKAEAKTYDKFACFCKDLSTQKSQSIADGQAAIDDYTATMEVLTTDRQELTDETHDLEKTIDELSKRLDTAHAERQKENAEFLTTESEMRLGENELNAAEKELKVKMSAVGGAALTQEDMETPVVVAAAARVSSMASEVKVPHRMADKVNKLAMLLVGTNAKTVTGNTNDIIEVLEDLEGDFHSTLSELRQAERESLTEYSKLRATKENEKKEAEQSLDGAQKGIAEKTEKLGTLSEDFSTTQATLADDRAYLLDLTAKCDAKSAQWDQRSSARTDEITAITTALHIIKGVAEEKEEEGGFVQLPRVRRAASALVARDAEKDALHGDGEVEDIVGTEYAPSLLQLAESPRKKMTILSRLKTNSSAKAASRTAMSTADVDLRDRVVNLLASRGKELKSATLSTLASQVSEDPFVKIKKLVQELVERLLQEAADEASHKGWCDKEFGKAFQKRDMKAADIKELNTAMAGHETKRDKLAQEIAELTQEFDELSATLDKLSKERSDESAENSAAISEAQDGKAAIDEAIDVLEKHYKTAAKAELLETSSRVLGVDEDMPDAGPDGAYKGSQGKSTGIIGMLEVVRSDFERTISQTEQEEKKSLKDFQEFELSTKSSMGTKKVGKEARQTESKETISELGEAKSSMEEKQTEFDKALEEIMELQPACIDSGMSSTEKAAKREQEIESLKEALCILGQQGPVQTEPGCDSL